MTSLLLNVVSGGCIHQEAETEGPGHVCLGDPGTAAGRRSVRQVQRPLRQQHQQDPAQQGGRSAPSARPLTPPPLLLLVHVPSGTHARPRPSPGHHRPHPLLAQRPHGLGHPRGCGGEPATGRILCLRPCGSVQLLHVPEQHAVGRHLPAGMAAGGGSGERTHVLY